MSSAELNSLSSGLASIANQTALSRVDTSFRRGTKRAAVHQWRLEQFLDVVLEQFDQFVVRVVNLLKLVKLAEHGRGPRRGTGTVPVTASTSLITLGIIPNAKVTVTDGTNTTIYISTGKDTVGDCSKPSTPAVRKTRR